MKSINYHIKAITTTFEELFKGNFLLFFIPGAVLTIIYFWLTAQASGITQAATLASDYSWFDWILGGVNSAVQGVFSIIGWMGEQIYIFMVLTLLSPFNTYLGEKLDAKYTGAKFEGGLVRFINDFIRMIFVVIIALFLELILMGIIAVFSWFIGFGFLGEIINFCIAAFFFGFSFYDFALERYEAGVFSSLGFAFSKPLTMILTGGVFLAIYNIPIIGIPAAPVITLMVSTMVYLYISKKINATTNINDQKAIENE